jgi:hypothetical protein
MFVDAQMMPLSAGSPFPNELRSVVHGSISEYYREHV